MKDMNTQYENLKRNILKACFNKRTPATNSRAINKFASQMRYIEKIMKPE